MNAPVTSDAKALQRIYVMLGACWTLVLLIFAGWTGWIAYSATLGNVRASAEESLHKDVIYRRWASMHGGVYVPKSEESPPNPDLADVKERDVATPSGRVLTLINPAYMNRQAHEIGNRDNGSRGHITSLTPLRAENVADPWEAAALTAFQSGEPVKFELSDIEGVTYFRLMRPLMTEASCLGCHSKQGYKLGEVRGGISASIPWKPYRDALMAQVATNVAGSVAIWLIGILGLKRVWRNLTDSLQERQLAEAALKATHAELKEAYQQLTQSQSQLLQSEKMAAVGQLAAGVAHEINNPVGFVSANLGTLSHYVTVLLNLIHAYEQHARTLPVCNADPALEAALQAADLDFLKEDISNLLHESQDGLLRVKKIVKGLKEFSHVDSNEWQEVDLVAGLESTLNIASHDIKYKAKIVRNYNPIPPVFCNLALINQVFLNLLINAVQAIDTAGVITVSTGVEGGGVNVSVEDSGCGIAPEQLNRIFEPFYTTKPVGEGTGLGLSIAYDIVKKHGGKITVRSTSGIGTCMCVWLPIKVDIVDRNKTKQG